jgi:hypothetical protein
MNWRPGRSMCCATACTRPASPRASATWPSGATTPDGGRSGRAQPGHRGPAAADVVVPLRLRHKDQELSLFTTNDVTVEELAIESFYPADHQTAEYLRSVAP